MPLEPALEPVPYVKQWQMILAGISASLVSIGLARFGYTPLIPQLISAHWFTASDVVTLGAANLAGYLVGAASGRTVGARIGNVNALRTMMLVVTLTFVACAFPLSQAWFFAWRLVSGIGGGVIMVLVAATLMPHVPPRRRSLTASAIFFGLGAGIACSGTLVPLLLESGLRATWIGLAAVAAAFTAASWFAWPPGSTHNQHPSPTRGVHPRAQSRAMPLLYLQYGLMAVALVPSMVFVVDFVARGLHQGARTGAMYWLLYGLGAMAATPFYGLLGDRLGARNALRIMLALQIVASLSFSALNVPLALQLAAAVAGTFPTGMVSLVLARVHQIEPYSMLRQNQGWSRATIVFAASQAAAGYACSAIFNVTHGDYHLLFGISVVSLVICLAIDWFIVADRKGMSISVIAE